MAADAASLPENTARPPAREARPSWLARLRARLFPRRLTKAERDELAAAKRERELLKPLKAELAMEAESYAHLISQKLEQLNICYRYKKSENSFERVKRVWFRRPFVLSQEAIYLEVDMRPGSLPRGVTIKALEDELILRDLSVVVGHKVSKKWAEGVGFWYIVEREYGVRGIPVHVDYGTMLLSRPVSASGLSLPLGIGDGKRAIWKDLGQMPHMLMGGTTGAGKSNQLNAILCTLLRFNSPRKLRLVLVDLKGGIEFAPYLGVPHIWKVKDTEGVELEGVVEDRKDVITWFQRIATEGERRMRVLRDAGIKGIGKYNNTHPTKPWPHIVVVIDEWSDVKLDPKVKGPAEELIINMASRFRVVGIHLILCTQVPTRETVPTRLKSVLPARVALSCPDLAGSMAIIGNGRAVKLEPEGRMVLNWGKLSFAIQGPRVTDETVAATVAQAIRGKFDDVRLAEHDVEHDEIFRWCINENTGHLDYRSVFSKFRLRGMTEPWAKAFCKDVEGELVVVGATTYKVMPGGPGVPRRLMEYAVELEPEDEVEPEPVAAADLPPPTELAVDFPTVPPLPAAAACGHCGQALNGPGPCAHCGAPPGGAPPAPTPPTPLTVQDRIVAALAGGPQSTGQLYKLVKGFRANFDKALAELVSTGVVTVEAGKGGAKLHSLTAPKLPPELPRTDLPLAGGTDEPNGQE